MRLLWLTILCVLGLHATVIAQNPTNLVCTPTGNPDEYTLTWSIPAGTTYTAVVIRENETVIATLPGNATTFTTTFSGMTNDDCANAATIAASPTPQLVTTQLLVACVEGELAGGIPTPRTCCFPFPGLIATTDGDDLAGFCDPGPDPDDQIYNDIWYCFTATATGPLRVATTGPDDARWAVYDSCACPASGNQVIGCSENIFPAQNPLFVNTVAGQEYLIRIGSAFPGTVFLTFLELSYDVEPPQNVTCDDTVPGEVTISWTLPSGTNYDAGINIYTPAGNLVATVPGTDTSFTYVLPGPVQGTVDYCVEGVTSNFGPSALACCSVVAPASNDDCASALSVGTGTDIFDFGTATTDGSDLGVFCDPGPSPDNQIYQDLWYCFQAPSDGTVRFEVVTIEPGRIAVYDGCSCPDDPSLVIGCDETDFVVGNPVGAVEFTAVAGNDYLLRLGTQTPGGSGLPPIGSYSVTYVVPGVTNLMCDDSVPGQVTLDWDNPAGVPYDGGINISVNGSLVTNLAGTDTSYVYVAPPAAAGFVDICVEGVNLAQGASTPACCTVLLGAPNNDLCANAEPVTFGTFPFDVSFATASQTGVVCNFITRDIWYLYSATTTGPVQFSLCGSSFDSVLAVYEAQGLCPPNFQSALACNNDFCGLASEVTVNVVAGTDYLVQVASADVGGPGTLTLGTGCSGVSGLQCAYDCALGSVDLSWTNNATYTDIEITANGVLVATVPGTSTSFVDLNPPMGTVVYEVFALCPAGASGLTTCALQVLPPPMPFDDTIINFDSPIVDSAMALEAALVSLGRTVNVLQVPDLLSAACLNDLLDQTDNIWVLLGSFPIQYPITTAELDLLASFAAAGKGLYIEGTARFTFLNQPSLIDERDGIDPAMVVPTMSLVDSLDGQDAVNLGIDLSTLSGIPYLNELVLPVPVGDAIEELAIASTGVDPDVTFADAVWRNDDNAGGAEGDFIVTVAALHSDGGVLISSSVEFGGIGDPTVQGQIASEYLSAFGNVISDPVLRRGDCNTDGSVNIADAVFLLGNLFPTGAPNVLTCLDACDGNDDGSLNIADTVRILEALFGVPATPLPMPYPDCGFDTTPSSLTCDQYLTCP